MHYSILNWNQSLLYCLPEIEVVNSSGDSVKLAVDLVVVLVVTAVLVVEAVISGVDGIVINPVSSVGIP